MTTNYVAKGETLTVTAPYAVSSGNGVLIGTSVFGVAVDAAAAAATDLVIQTVGVFDITKVAAETWVAGDPIYWDNTDRKCTNVGTGSPTMFRIGSAVAAAASSTTTGRVRIDGFAVEQ